MDVTRIAISMGDPRGIGPEIVLKALARPIEGVRALVYGDVGLFERTAQQLGVSLPGAGVTWIPCGAAASADLTEAAAGGQQVQALDRAVDAVLAGEAQALCTAPISKAAATAAGFAYPGHTEYLAARGGAAGWAMMLAGPQLRVVPLTGHLPLSEVPGKLNARGVQQALVLVARALRQDFAVPRPRIALTGLNPHAGEQGVLGGEERELFAPALAAARGELEADGVPAELEGPLPADGLFADAPGQRYDAVVCGYHDQALIPFKMVHRDDGVNVTLGLPFVRTSPAHGTAFDIAGRGVAREGSMVAALRMAAELHRRRARSASPPAGGRSAACSSGRPGRDPA